MSTNGVRNKGLAQKLGMNKRGGNYEVSPSPQKFYMGYRSKKPKDGELEHGWNSNTSKWEYKHPLEWERLQELAGVVTKTAPKTMFSEEDFPPLPSSKSKPPTPKPKSPPKQPDTLQSVTERLKKEEKRFEKHKMQKTEEDIKFLLELKKFKEAGEVLDDAVEELNMADAVTKRYARYADRIKKLKMLTEGGEVKALIDDGHFKEAGLALDSLIEHLGVIEMNEIEGGGGVHVVSGSWKGANEARLRIERKASEKLRANLTENIKSRKGTAKESLAKNCDMASGLATALEKHPEMLAKEGGMFSRIVGTIEGQGQHAVPDPVVISKRIKDAVGRLQSGDATGDDGNIVTQFISCFADGLTEVNEGKVDRKQLEDLFEAMGFKGELIDKLLKRVQGYKEIANAFADTGEGKGTRKDETRKGLLPEDERHHVFDPNALIKGDISGSMHSCLIAQELAETLFAGEEIKEMGAPVSVKDKELLNARVVDALALTAGGKKDGSDIVLHTAYEMINGIQAITGMKQVSQPIATEIMDQLTKGVPFTDAVEKIYKGEKMPWQV